jgi:hypothetical protein
MKKRGKCEVYVMYVASFLWGHSYFYAKFLLFPSGIFKSTFQTGEVASHTPLYLAEMTYLLRER